MTLIYRLHEQPSESGVLYHWINSLAIGHAINAAAAVAANIIYLHYFPLPRKCRFDRIGLQVNGASPTPAATALALLYDDTGNLYPNRLVQQSDPLDVTAVGLKQTTIDLILAKGAYWLGYFTHVADWNLLRTDYGLCPIGDDLGFAQTCAWWIAATYPTVPDPFPAGGSTGGFYYGTGLRLLECLEG